MSNPIPLLRYVDLHGDIGNPKVAHLAQVCTLAPSAKRNSFQLTSPDCEHGAENFYPEAGLEECGGTWYENPGVLNLENSPPNCRRNW
jgi:hypothetical protein